MRIITGTAGRIAIKVPLAVARPTTDMMRQAIYSMLGDGVKQAKILDLFAGSGALGLEALSRGAQSATFVENNRQAVLTIQDNLKKTKLTGGQVISQEVLTFLKRDTQQYDVIFADPPYWKHHGDKDWIAEMLSQDLILPRMLPKAWFVVEMSARQTTPEIEAFNLLTRREYGSSSILIFEAAQQASH